MTEDEFRLFRTLIQRECGLHFANNKRNFLSSQIGKRVAACALTSYYSYYRYLADGPDRRAELLRMLDLLTIHETSFLRNRAQFELFQNRVVPEIVESYAGTTYPQLRIWSAGCSTGEEPYSIAICANEALSSRLNWKIKIFASDLSLTVLERASSGVYSHSKLQGLDEKRRERYFDEVEEGYEVRAELKRQVIFDFHNLKHDNGLRNLDVVFCRNVLIYFDTEEQLRVLGRFVQALRPGGYLFLGHSESVDSLRSQLKFICEGKGTAYQKVEGR